jgi:hypothetical protein
MKIKTNKNKSSETQDDEDRFYYNDNSDLQEVFEGLSPKRSKYSSYDDSSEDNY